MSLRHLRKNANTNIAIIIVSFAIFWAIWVRWRRFRQARIDPVMQDVGDSLADAGDSISDTGGRFKKWLGTWRR